MVEAPIYLSQKEKELSERRDRVAELMLQRGNYLSKKHGLPKAPEYQIEEEFGMDFSDACNNACFIPEGILRGIRIQEFYSAGYAHIDRRYEGLHEELNRLNKIIPYINCSQDQSE